MKKSINELSPDQLKAVSEKKIYFGHQSVGYNIFDGLEQVNTSLPTKLNIVEFNKLDSSSNAYFTHGPIGQNKKPLLKISDFKNKIDNELKGDIDIAFFKFCYVDIHKSTDIDEVFTAYSATMNELKETHPNVKFVHFTAPIRIIDKGIKGLLKKVMGKSMEIEDNYARMQYNKMLLEHYSGKEPVFDIASLEAIKSDGSIEYGNYKGEQVYALPLEYTIDRGHLNEQGSKYIAEQLLIFLSEELQ